MLDMGIVDGVKQAASAKGVTPQLMRQFGTQDVPARDGCGGRMAAVDILSNESLRPLPDKIGIEPIDLRQSQQAIAKEV